jgi:hypothetical protein
MTDPRTVRLAWSQEASPLLVPALLLVVMVSTFCVLLGLLFTSDLAVGALFPLVLGLVSLFLRGGRRRAGGSLELGADGSLRLRRGRRSLVLARDEITSVLRARPLTLRLDTRHGRQLRLGLESEVDTDGASVLEHLRAHLALGSGQRALSMALRPLVGAFTWSLIVAVGLEMALVVAGGAGARLFPHAPAEIATLFLVLGLFLPFVLAPYCARKLAFARLTVGEDGVLLERFASRRLLGYRQLASVQLVGGVGLRLIEHDGAQHHARGYGGSELAEVMAHIRLQIARYAENAGTAGDALARGDRTLADWRRALGQLARGGGGFREQTMTPEVLHRIVVDAAAPLERRVGAALALREVDPAAGPRVRLAAEGSVEARARLALEAAAEDQLDDGRLEAALSRRALR